MLNDSGLRGVQEERSKAGTVTAMNVRGMLMSGHLIPLVKRGKNISLSLTFSNIGEDDLNAYAVFKCYRKRDGALVWEFMTIPQKVVSNETAEFVAYMNSGFLLPMVYFIESTGRFYTKHIVRDTRVFRKDFRVVR